jgi:hypothetical protein
MYVDRLPGTIKSSSKGRRALPGGMEIRATEGMLQDAGKAHDG